MQHKIDQITSDIEKNIDSMELPEDIEFFTCVLEKYAKQRKSVYYFQQLYEYIELRKEFLKEKQELAS